MYLNAPYRQPAPGTELVERYYGGFGLGSYVATQRYSMTPAASSGIRGLGCNKGVGCPGVGAFMDGSGVLGTGLFTSSSPADWGPGEWAVVVIGGYIVASTVFTTNQGVAAAKRKGRAVRKALRA